MTMYCNLSEAERHAYITGDVATAALIGKIIDLTNENHDLTEQLIDDDSDN